MHVAQAAYYRLRQASDGDIGQPGLAVAACLSDPQRLVTHGFRTYGRERLELETSPTRKGVRM